MFLISLANILPRLASTTAFLCLVVAHLEWPLMLSLVSAPRRWGACDARSLLVPALRASAHRVFAPLLGAGAPAMLAHCSSLLAAGDCSASRTISRKYPCT